MKKFVLFLMLVVSNLAIAVDVSKDAPKQDQPVELSQVAENTLLKAENKFSKIKNDELQISIDFSNLQQQASNLQSKYADLQSKEKEASKEVDEATENAWKVSGLDKTKYDFDAASFKFNPKKTGSVKDTLAPVSTK